MAKQKELPGVEKPRVVAVEEAAEAFVEAHERRSDAAEREKVAKETLIDKMRGAKLSSYRFDGKLIVLEKLDKVTVKQARDEGDED